MYIRGRERDGVCTVFMQQGFGIGGDSGYGVKIILPPLGKPTNTHTHTPILTYFLNWQCVGLLDGRASQASHVLCLSCGLQKEGEEGSLNR